MENIKINYQKKMQEIIDNISKEERVYKLLLHSCCGPCSSYVLEYLSKYFEITVFYYNPNIYPSEEYYFRVKEQRKLIDLIEKVNPIHMIEGKYETEKFYEMAKGLEDLKEGGKRCHKCYEMRLRQAAKIAKEGGFDYFTTTLSISPHKNSQVLNNIAEKVAKEIGVKHLSSDFKKNNGYKRSCEITRELGMYRQDYCGCEFSKKEKEKRDLQKAKQELREDIKQKIQDFDDDEIKNSDKIIIEKLLQTEEYKKSKNIFCYLGRKNEIDTSLFIKKALSDGKTISVPVCLDEENMSAYIVNNLEGLKENKFGILEPDIKTSKIMKKEDIDLVIVPCCSADSKGNRLGYGKGYYDRYLKDIKAKTILMIRKNLMVENIPHDKEDIKIGKVITD